MGIKIRRIQLWERTQIKKNQRQCGCTKQKRVVNKLGKKETTVAEKICSEEEKLYIFFEYYYVLTGGYQGVERTLKRIKLWHLQNIAKHWKM